MFPRIWNNWHKRVIDTPPRPPRLPITLSAPRKALAHVVNILLIGHTDDEDICAIEGFLRNQAESLRNFADNQLWHFSINLTGQFNKACRNLIFTRLIGQINGSMGMQCPPKAGPGIKRHKPNGFVAAPSITSQTSMSIASKITFNSLTKAIFTERKMFSVNLMASAASARHRHNLRNHTLHKVPAPFRAASGVSPPTILGMVEVENFIARVFAFW